MWFAEVIAQSSGDSYESSIKQQIILFVTLRFAHIAAFWMVGGDHVG